LPAAFHPIRAILQQLASIAASTGPSDQSQIARDAPVHMRPSPASTIPPKWRARLGAAAGWMPPRAFLFLDNLTTAGRVGASPLEGRPSGKPERSAPLSGRGVGEQMREVFPINRISASGQGRSPRPDPKDLLARQMNPQTVCPPSTEEATHPRCCDEGYPDGPGRASNKEGESWGIIAKPLSELIRHNRVMQ
jgi:hypothetical protein